MGHMDETSSARLLAAVARGDRGAFGELYDAWAPRLFALILRVVRDREHSEEVLQEVFLEVWRQACQFSAAKGSARAWLVTVARRRAIDRVRAVEASRGRETAFAGQVAPVAFDETASVAHTHLALGEVRAALDVVGEPHRTTLLLAYFSGLTGREIAVRLGVPIGTVKTRLRDGLGKLRKELGVTQ